MGQVLGRLARSRRVQLTPIPQADGKQFAAAEQKCMAGRTPELLYRQVAAGRSSRRLDYWRAWRMALHNESVAFTG